MLVSIQNMKNVSGGQLINWLKKCTENIEKVKLAKIILAGKGKNEPKYSSCTLHIVLLLINFTINVGIGSYFVYYKCTNHQYLRKYVTRIKFGTCTQTKNYQYVWEITKKLLLKIDIVTFSMT